VSALVCSVCQVRSDFLFFLSLFSQTNKPTVLLQYVASRVEVGDDAEE
jgi:hypothetical protein